MVKVFLGMFFWGVALGAVGYLAISESRREFRRIRLMRAFRRDFR